MKKGFLLVIGLFTIAFSTRSQKVFTPAELKQDCSIIRKALEEAHPGLYRYNSREKIRNELVKLEHKLNKGMTELEFFRLVNPFIAGIGDGHTKFHRDGRPDDYYAFFEDGYFPYQLYFREGKAYVRRSYVQEATLPAGTEIKSINGRKIEDILQLLFRQILADGDVTSWKYEELSDQFAGYYATFLGSSNEFRIGYKEVMGKKGKQTVRGVKRNEITKLPVASDAFQLSYPADKVALLRIPVFQEVTEGGFASFLSTAFAEIKAKGILSLIIDLRGNEGGTDAFGFELYSYLALKPFRYYDRFTTASDGNFSFLQYASLPPQFDYLKQFIVKVGHEYHFTAKDGLDLMQPKADAFQHKVYILQNGRSFSVTSEFASIARDNNRAVFVGEESGGTLQGDNSGAFAIVKLPNTKIALAVPLLGYYMHLSPQNANARGGVPVDHTIRATISDVLKNRDVVLEKTLQLIK
jgi:hypothetical protein